MAQNSKSLAEPSLEYCSDLRTEFNSYCWQVLGLSEWLRDWKKSSPSCTLEEPWTICFMRIGYGGPGSYCSQINGDSCSYSARLSDDLAEEEKPMFKYILYNIQSVHILFSTWYTAMEFAVSHAADTITSIVKLLDPQEKTYVQVNDILLAIGVGAAFLFVPEVAPFVSAVGKRVGGALVAGAQQAPAVAKALWPIGTVDSQLTQIATLSESLFDLMPKLEARINEGLRLVQTDVETFLAFTSSGNLSAPGDERPSLPNQTEYLLLAFTTFLVSSALVGNGWNVLMAVDVNPLAIANGSASIPEWARQNWAWPTCPECGRQTDLDLDCKQYDANNQCNYWFYSTNHLSAYTLGEGSRHDPTDLISTILNQKWSTGSLLFENAALCSFLASPKNFDHFLNAKPKYISRHPTNASLEDPSNPKAFLIWESLDDKRVHWDEELNGIVWPNTTSLEEFYTPGSHENYIHPNNTFLNITDNGEPDFSCVSQLDLAILVNWDELYHLYRHEGPSK